MFTGIIEEIGAIRAIQPSSAGMKLTITGEKVLQDAKIGDSIAVNGVCLTVETLGANAFTADVMHETMKATTLGSLSTQSAVNLERALAAGDRFGGHFVSGHVDTVGQIVKTRRKDNARYVEIDIPEPFRRYLIQKGSVAVDGTSLTLFGVTERGFIISLIPTTERDTVLGAKDVGDPVNIECDMFAKYIDELLTAREQTTQSSGVTMDVLMQNGFV
ncbi:riboflavin synthase [Savagea faecisuis]|uniref:Riboflavin synthase n=1 Tax=Savagea faecisuis TaxID=1274803 RepID=A0ABW3GXV8_9BACL